MSLPAGRAGAIDGDVPQISRLLPLDEDSLKQIITYHDTLPRDVAAEQLGGLLGDSPQALEFIASFNSRRQTPPAEAKPAAAASSNQNEGVPKRQAKQPKKKANIHNLPARQVQDLGGASGAYRKQDEGDYMAGSSRGKKPQPSLSNALALQEAPDARQLPVRTAGGVSRGSKAPPSASGPLISDVLPPPSQSSTPRTASPAPTKTKVNITGGTNMHGAGKTLSDLDSAIRALELQTNPTLASNSQSAADLAKRRCNCMATRHPLLTIAPNCLSCGKIVCVKEGLGPCTFCESPLLSSSEIASMVRVLKDERGKERQAANNASHKRAEVSQKPRAFTGRDFLSSSAAASTTASPLSSAPPSEDEGDNAVSKAKEHRDKLLAFQANNARRTRIHDEAADFDVPTSGTNMWASPTERAAELKRQQKIMREMEWNARPEYEKRRMVASIDVVGGKLVKRMAKVERPASDAEEEEADEEITPVRRDDNAGSGAFSNNPLMGALIRPTARAEKGKAKGQEGSENRKSAWRRVQDDNDDNEQWILDGGAYGGRVEARRLGEEEHAVGS
ncbi:zf-C2HC5-domain-containing protein [Aureobasidium pullulans]|nr:zf-C2HC5-domain-containing protein [Aureobasidium pullulans]